MSILYINTGSTANAGDGDSLRTAFTKINQNFQFIGGLTSGALEAGTGFTGSQGEYGYTGSGGFDGSRGFVGSRGAGYTGSASEIPGPIGYAGSRGFLGYVGSQGNLGPIGYVGSASTEVGYAGSQGDQGPIGYVGSQSTEIGYTGSQGEQGIGFVGSQGVTGYAGSRGDLGFTGSIGPEGPQGFSPDVVPGGIYIELDPDPVYTNQGAVYVSTLTQTFVDGQAVRLRANIFRDNTTPIAIGVIREDGGAGALLVFDENNILTMYQMAPGYQNAISQQYDLSNNIFGIRRYLTMEWQVTPDSVNGSVLFGGVLGIGAVEMEQVDPFFLNLGDITNGAWYLCAYSGGGRQDIADVAYELGIGIGGANGYTGSAGAGYTGSASTAIGYTGSSGNDGFTGSIGYSGSTGYVGSASTEAGPQGLQGFDGSIGYTGSRGAGFTGSAGVIGYTGSRGFVGSTGFIGSRGDTGFIGSFGYTGSVGPQGIQGDTGLDGLIGYTGSTGFGFTGSAGAGYTGSRSTLPGPLGYTGSAGIGVSGDRGYTGSGGTGFTGSSGTSGTNGYTGSAGANGTNGYSGSKGDSGYTGSSGTNGYTGSAGLDTYTPTTPADWSGTPTVATFTAGLDELAGRLVAVEGNTGGSGSQLLADQGVPTFGQTATAGFAFNEDKRDTGMFSPDNGHLELYSNARKIFEGTDNDVSIITSNDDYSGTSTWHFGRDGILTLPGGNTRIGNVFGSDAIVANTGTGVGVLGQGTGGYAALQWIDNIENIGTTLTQVAAVVVNSPIASTSGTVQILTGTSDGPVNSNIWEFGNTGTLTLPNGTAIGSFDSPNGIELKAFAQHDYVELSYNSDQYLWADASGAYIATNYTATGHIWTFAKDGVMSTPGHLIPNADLTHDLGSPTAQWRSIYVGTGTVYIGGVALGVNRDNYVTVDGNPIITVNTSGNLTVQGDTNIVLGAVLISDTAPLATTPGSQWFNTVEARAYVAYNGQWLDASPTVLPLPDTNPTLESVTFNNATVQTTAWTGTYSYTDLTDKPTFVGGGGASTWLTAE